MKIHTADTSSDKTNVQDATLRTSERELKYLGNGECLAHSENCEMNERSSLAIMETRAANTSKICRNVETRYYEFLLVRERSVSAECECVTRKICDY